MFAVNIPPRARKADASVAPAANDKIRSAACLFVAVPFPFLLSVSYIQVIARKAPNDSMATPSKSGWTPRGVQPDAPTSSLQFRGSLGLIFPTKSGSNGVYGKLGNCSSETPNVAASARRDNADAEAR